MPAGGPAVCSSLCQVVYPRIAIRCTELIGISVRSSPTPCAQRIWIALAPDWLLGRIWQLSEREPADPTEGGERRDETIPRYGVEMRNEWRIANKHSRQEGLRLSRYQTDGKRG